MATHGTPVVAAKKVGFYRRPRKQEKTKNASGSWREEQAVTARRTQRGEVYPANKLTLISCTTTTPVPFTTPL